jgi:hypothetical protein
MVDTAKHIEKINEAKGDIAEYLAGRLTQLQHETAIHVVDLSIYTVVTNRGVGNHVKDLSVIEVSFVLEDGTSA